MKISFKTLQQKTFTLECNDMTVNELKRILAERPEVQSEPDLIKAIYKGKILSNELLSTLGIEEKDFIVVMVTKKKAPTSSTVAPSPSSATTAVATPATVVPSEPATAVNAQPDLVTPTAAANPAPEGDNQLATGSALETAVNNLVDMGFPRDQVLIAMRAAFNNPDRAAEYLMSGIPENLQQEIAGEPTTSNTVPVNSQPSDPPERQTGYTNLFAPPPAANNQPTTATNSNSSLDFLRTNPQFLEMRDMVRAQPEMLQPLLSQISQTNPELIRLIQQNQDQFLNLLNEGMEGQHEENVISITQEENDAIERLCALGFDRNMAIEAYFACDKNEEMAANYLFDLQ